MLGIYTQPFGGFIEPVKLGKFDAGIPVIPAINSKLDVNDDDKNIAFTLISAEKDSPALNEK